MKNLLFVSFLISIASLLILNSCDKVDNTQLLNEIQALKRQNDSIILSLTYLQKKSDSTLIALNNTNQNTITLSKKIDSLKSQLDSYLIQIILLNNKLNQVGADITSIKEDIVALQVKCQELMDLLSKLILQSSTLNNGLLAYYPFTGNANDSSGNLNHGTVLGATLTIDRNEQANSAYKFGTNKVIHVKSPSNELNLTADFSISSWFKFDTLAKISNTSMILSKHHGDIGNDGWTYGVWNHNWNFTSQFVNFWGNNNIGGTSTYPGSEGIVKEGIWYNYIVTYDNSSKQLKYYLNGILIFSKNLPFTIIPNNYDITIGYQNSNSTVYKGYFSGTIDDIRVYNRVLNTQEVSELYKK